VMEILRKSESNQFEAARKHILSLLYVDGNSPIHGKTMLIKQVFILAKEIVPEIDPVLDFYPYQIGPYSTILARMLNAWIREGIVSAEKTNRDWAFSLTEKGKQNVEKYLEEIDNDILDKTRKMKKVTLEWGTNGILNYVYRNYPEYAITSRIRGSVLDSRC